MIPSEVVAAIKRILAQGKEAIVKKERGKWVVLENSKHLVYKEPRIYIAHSTLAVGRANRGYSFGSSLFSFCEVKDF